MAHPYPHGASQLAAKQTAIADHPLVTAVANNRSMGRETTRIQIRLELYNVSRQRGVSGKYIPWNTMRWKHDIETPAEGEHFARTLDAFIAKYQLDPMGMQGLLEGYEPDVVEKVESIVDWHHGQRKGR